MHISGTCLLSFLMTAAVVRCQYANCCRYSPMAARRCQTLKTFFLVRKCMYNHNTVWTEWTRLGTPPERKQQLEMQWYTTRVMKR